MTAIIHEKKHVRNAHSKNPKKNPSCRRHGFIIATTPIPYNALKEKLDAAGKPIPGKFVRFFGGRKPSKYGYRGEMPVIPVARRRLVPKRAA